MSTGNNQNATKTIIICSGSKGGVGKSLLAGSLCDAFLDAKKDFTLIDCDAANADAVMWCGSIPPAGNGDFRHKIVPIRDKWDPLLDIVANNSAPVFVVNMGAGDAPIFVKAGKFFQRIAKSNGWRIVLAYMLSPSYGSIRPLLLVAQEISGWADLIILKNKYFPEDHWELWHKIVPRDSKDGTDPVRTIVLKNPRVVEDEFPLLPGRALINAYDPEWKSLRELEAVSNGAYLGRIQVFRQEIARIIAGNNLC